MQMSLRYFDFEKATKTLRIASEEFGGTFPSKIEIKSHHTGAIEVFVQDQDAAIENEFWDGEQCQYKPVKPLPNVEKLVVYHAY